MSMMQKIMETVVQYMPDKEPDPLMRKHGYIGKPFSRVDGRLKVTGEASFSAEFKLENLVYAAIVCSTIAKGKITEIDSAEAEKAVGVLAIITFENAPEMNAPPVYDMSGGSRGAAGSDLPILRDEQIYYDGQPIAVVVGETQEQAEHAASLVKVEYETETAAVSFDDLKAEAFPPPTVLGEPPKVAIGDVIKGLNDAEFVVDNIYRTPRYNPNAIEPHATIAAWEADETLMIYDSTQNLYAIRNTLAKMFDLAEEKVRVVAPFVGGGFGGKGMLWDNTALCAVVAVAPL